MARMKHNGDLQKSNLLQRFFASRPAMMIASVVIAVILWFVISICIYPTTPRTVQHVPLKLEIAGTSAEDNGLSVIDFDVEEVTVQIEGDRSRIGNLDAQNLYAVANLDNVTTAGTKNLSIDVKSSDNVQFTVKSVSPSKVNVTFDNIVTMPIEVRPSTPNITFAEGCVLDEANYLASPAEIDVTGPKRQLEQVAYAMAETTRKEQLNASKIMTSEKLSFFSEKGVQVDDDDFTYDVAAFSISVPVLYQKTMDITYQITNAPAGFDLDSLKLELSEKRITLAAPNASMDEMKEFNIGSVSLSNIDLDFSSDFEVVVPDEYVNQSGFSTVNLSLDADGLAKKDFVISDIGVINAPASYNFDVLTKQMTVSIIGPEEIVNEMDVSDITVNVDLLSFTTQADAVDGDSVTFNYTPTISCDRYHTVWAVGDYQVSVQGRKIPAATTAAERSAD